MENYYGKIKQYMTSKELYDIGKINKKTMCLTLIEKGHDLYIEKNTKKQKIKSLINTNNNKETKEENKNDKTKVKNFLDSIYMKRIFTYLKRILEFFILIYTLSKVFDSPITILLLCAHVIAIFLNILMGR